MKKSNAASVNPTQQSTICPDCPSCWKGYVAHSEGLLRVTTLINFVCILLHFCAAASDIGFLFRVATFHVWTTLWQWAGLPLVRLDRCQLKGTIALGCSVKHVKVPNQKIWSVGNPGAFWSSHFFTRTNLLHTGRSTFASATGAAPKMDWGSANPKVCKESAEPGQRRVSPSQN